MSRFVRVRTSDLIPADWMPFPEEWNMKSAAWFPGGVPDLEGWVRKLASASFYSERCWRDLAKGQWEAKNHGLGDAVELRPAPANEVEVPKPSKDRKRRMESSENPSKPKKSVAQRPKADTMTLSPETAQRLREQEEEEDDDCLLVTHEKRKNVDAPTPIEPVAVDVAQSRAEKISEGSSNKVPEPSSRKKAPRLGDHLEGEGERPDPEPLQIRENSLIGSLGVINVDDSPPGPEFSEGQIRDAHNMRSSEVEASHEGHDIFRECLAGLDDGLDPDASFVFDEARSLFKQAVVLHKRAFSKS
ncbi:uncharacterized protein LOC142164810 [Nicotiana tabacum]|uniref:Uncharacterized protein LOC142164810 n=1 Tax=Nicotiana tabacum TaxID=4097 RepID=A0AC58S3R2_TOBAC